MHTYCTSGAYHERAGPWYAWALPSDNRNWRHRFDRCQPYPPAPPAQTRPTVGGAVRSHDTALATGGQKHRWRPRLALGRGLVCTLRRLMHIDPYSLDRSRRFRRESTAILTLSPKETWRWTSISKPSLWHCTSLWTILTRATSNPACPPAGGRRHR